MITLPVGFDTVGLIGEFFSIFLQITPLIVMVSIGFLVLRVLRRV